MTLGWEGFEQVSGIYAEIIERRFNNANANGPARTLSCARWKALKETPNPRSRIFDTFFTTLRSMKPEGTSALHD